MPVLTEASASGLASAFSTAVFRAMSRPGWPQPLSRLKALVEVGKRSGSPTLGAAFDAAHEVLKRDYRSEYVFKNELVSKLIFGKHSPRTAGAILELPMGRSCADLVILNGTTTTYEVKTDLDQFARLSAQLEDYCSRTEYVVVVTSDKRATQVERYLTDQIGIVAVRANGALATIRPSGSNMDRLQVDHLFQLLRTEEALEILARTLSFVLDVQPGYAWPRAREVFAELEPSVAHAEVVNALRGRALRSATLGLSPTFPRSLRALAYATNLSRAARSRIEARLSMPLERAFSA